MVHRLSESGPKLVWFFDIVGPRRNGLGLRGCMAVLSWWSDLSG